MTGTQTQSIVLFAKSTVKNILENMLTEYSHKILITRGIYYTDYSIHIIYLQQACGLSVFDFVILWAISTIVYTLWG